MVKFECPQCGYTMQTAQYLNGKGHCLKCNAVVADKIEHPLNPEWVKKMKVKFDKLNSDGAVNKNGYGTLDFDEMKVLLKKGDPSMTDDECRKVFDGADDNGNGVIEFTEFLWFLYGGAGGKGGGGGAKGPKGAPAMAGQGQRAPGETGKYKLSPSDACESESGECKKHPDGAGPCHFKFGKCSYCGKGEGQLVKGNGTFAYAGGGGGCPKGGKCMFKFSKCSKCGKKEF